jgi:hypothetical protein
MNWKWFEKEIGRLLRAALSHNLSIETEENYKTPQSEYPVAHPRFEPTIYLIEASRPAKVVVE